MGNNGKGSAGKKIIAGLVIGIVAVCLLAGILLLLTLNNDQPVLSNSLTLKLSGNGMVTDDQILSAKNVLQKRFDALNYNVSINPTRNNLENTGLTINYGNISPGKIASIATIPGLIDMRIQTSGNESEHVLYSDEIESARIPAQSMGASESEMWIVDITLTPSGARGLQQACIQYGAIADPVNHSIMLLLDGKVFSSAPISQGLAQDLATKPVDHLMLNTGPGDEGKNVAEMVAACLQSGVLPLRIEVVSNGNQTI